MMMSTALANSVHFENWTANHVAEWLRGLDDAILPYVHFFLNNNIDGKKLMLLTPFDLEKISIMKVGHQELILEAVDLLKSLRYGYETETLQHLALQLGCKARSLHNEIQAKSLENDKNRANVSQGPPSRRLSIKILSALADLSMTLKNVVSWLDRSPFESMYGLCLLRNTIVKLGIDLVSSYQKDSRQADIEENISKSCMILTEVCDELVIKNKESLVVQPASLEQATIRKKPGEELGMHIQSSYYGIHVIGGIKEMSPADLCGKIEKGDEVIQVNHKTVVGWQLTKLVNSLKEKPKEVILVLKKRPHHIMPYGHVANKKKMNKVAVSTLPKSIKKRRSREGGDPKQARPSLQELVSTVRTDDMDSPREERTSDEKDDGNDTDNDVFRSGSESPQYVKPSTVDPKQRRATVSGGSPTLSRTLLGPEDIETPTRPKSFTVSATDAPQIEYREHGIPGEDSNLLRLGDANKIINAQQKRQEFRTAKSVPQSLEFVVKKPTAQEATPRLQVTRAEQNIELINDPPDPDDQSISQGLLEVPSRFQNFGTSSQGTDEDIDTSDTQPHISTTSSSDTLTEDTIKSEDNLRSSHSPQPSLSPQPPSLSPQPQASAQQTSQPRSLLSQSHQEQSDSLQPKSHSQQSQSEAPHSEVLQSQSSEPQQPKPWAPRPLPRSLKSKTSLESGSVTEQGNKHTVDREAISLGDLASEEDVGEVFTEETMPGVAVETTSTGTYTDQKMDANYNNAATQEATNTSGTNSSEILDPNGNTAATATDNQNLANTNNNLNLRSQSSLNKFDPITNKPIPAERHSIKPSIPRTSARDGVIEARAVDLEKPRQISESGEVALPQKQKNQPQLMGYRKIPSFTHADKEPPGRWSASSSPGSQRRSDASLDSIASSVVEESTSYKVVIVSGVPQKIPLEKTPSMESSGSVILRPKKTKKVDRRVSCRDLGEGDCQGWLWKGKNRGDGPLSKHWLKRWCVLKHQNMFFFKDQEDLKAEGVIHLPAFQVTPASKDEVKTKKFTGAFKIHNAGTKFIFASERMEDMKKWLLKFQLASIKPTTLPPTKDQDPSFSESDEEPDDGSSTSTANMQESTEDLGVLMRQIQKEALSLDGTDRGKQRKTLLSVGGDEFPSRDTIKKVKQLYSLERTVRAKEKELAEIEKLLSLPSKGGLKSFQEVYMKSSSTDEPQNTVSSDSDSEVSSYI